MKKEKQMGDKNRYFVADLEQQYLLKRRLLEAMSEDIVKMEINWKMESPEAEVESVWPTLTMRLAFVESALNHTDWDTEGVRPVEGEGKTVLIRWNWALLFDVCGVRGLVHREHPDDSFDIKDAFFEGRFIGWEVRFFDTFDEVEAFIREHWEYEQISLYHCFRKQELRYGYYDKGKTRYTDRYDYYEQEQGFIELPGLMKITVKNRTKETICRTEKELTIALRNLYGHSPADDEGLRCEVTFVDRHQAYEGVLYGHPQNSWDCVLQEVRRVEDKYDHSV